MALEDFTPDTPEELGTVADDTPTSHQRSPRTDPAMRDGDSAHGNPNETDVGQMTTDNDTGDVADEPAVAGFDGSAAEGTTADLRADVDTDADDFSLRADAPGDALDVIDDEAPPTDGTDMLPSHPAGEEQLPIRDYGRLTVKEAAERAKALPPDEVKKLRDFEAAHRNRKTLIAQLDRMMNTGG